MSSVHASRTRGHWLALVALILAGEMIFGLPFHLPRYFRPSMLEAFGLSNADLGDIFAVYGVTAMLAYFPGGALADRFAARGLMVTSLLLTATGGLYLATLPGPRGLAVLYGYWGVTTILLFWSALIRATRQWGGSAAQGRAFGLLDGGRGLAAAAVAACAVAAFGALMPAAGDAVGAVGAEARREAMRAVVLGYSAVTLLAAALVWRALDTPAAADAARRGFELAHLLAVTRRPAVWLQAAIVVCAYCGYKGLDNYALYVYDVLGYGETRASAFTAGAAWLRPVAAIAAGLVADRAGAGRSIVWLFAALTVVYASLALSAPDGTGAAFVLGNLLASFAAVFALRGIYFALLEEVRVPVHATGTAVGLVSVIGYTPDIFFAPVAGRLLDATPGLGGHQHYFWLLTGIAVIGTLTAAALVRLGRRVVPNMEPAA